MGVTDNYLSLAATMIMLLLVVDKYLAGKTHLNGVHRPCMERILEAGVALFAGRLWPVAGRRWLYPGDVVLL